MNIEPMQLLAKILIQGNRKEAPPSNALRRKINNHYHYTVTGVMADVYISETKQAKWRENISPELPSEFVRANGECWRLDVPDEVLTWYGLTREQSNQLWVMSARGYTFDQIGKSILRVIEGARKEKK